MKWKCPLCRKIVDHASDVHISFCCECMRWREVIPDNASPLGFHPPNRPETDPHREYHRARISVEDASHMTTFIANSIEEMN